MNPPFDAAKAIVGASHIFFGPGTLGRTWGTRLVPSRPTTTQTPSAFFAAHAL
jgi:hypothetical protein